MPSHTPATTITNYKVRMRREREREREKGKAMKFSDHNLLNFMTYIKISLKWIVNISLYHHHHHRCRLRIRLASLFMIFSFSHQELSHLMCRFDCQMIEIFMSFWMCDLLKGFYVKQFLIFIMISEWFVFHFQLLLYWVTIFLV